MSYRLSRVLSAATAGYGVYALTQPAHLWQVLEAERKDREGLQVLATTYGVRDLAISAAGVLGRPGTVRASMMLRVAMDLGDCAVLVTRTHDAGIRRKVMAVTLGWAGLNALALAVDSIRDGG